MHTVETFPVSPLWMLSSCAARIGLTDNRGNGGSYAQFRGGVSVWSSVQLLQGQLQKSDTHHATMLVLLGLHARKSTAHRLRRT